jgi:hypothetical protein
MGVNHIMPIYTTTKLIMDSNMTSFFRFENKRAIYPMIKSHLHMHGTHLSQVIKSQNKIIYTVVNVLNIYIH